ncbi:MAG: ABC-F family ATP-binding cassette domain-containing protein [Campylobacterales bacterium]
MTLIDLEGISKQYEAQVILKEASMVIEEGERICIVGKNGSGKSTLMKIAAGLLEPDEGKVRRRQGVTIEMLAQEPRFDPGITVRAAIEAQLTEIRAARQRFDEIASALEQSPDNRQLLEESGALASWIEHHNGWNLDDRIERILQEFQLKPFEERRVDTLSGGERRRVALAGLLLKKPDLLLLDEPTNHLDVYMVAFLEELLLAGRFTLLFISHDRYFIDRIATRTIEIDEARVRSYKGGYLDYITQKEEELRALQKEHETLLKQLKAEEEWLRRGVKARLKRNEGRKERIMQMREQARKNPGLIRQIRLQVEREKKHFNDGQQRNRQKMLFEAENLTLTLGNQTLIKGFTTRILQKDRIAIVGRNGSGKSSFLKLLMGSYQPTSGTITRGDFTIGYFDQHREMLDDNKNLIETFCPNGGDRVEVLGRSMHVYGYLKNFLFPREFLDKKIGVLSGGEKNRVALALLLSKKYDCLILDEPTNDLDIPTIQILEEYLQNFPGALLFVSHDRYFVDKLAQRLFIFKGGGIVEESWQSYTEYLDNEAEWAEIEAQISLPQPSPKERLRERSEQLSYKEKRELTELPQQIEELEAKIAECKACLSNPDCYQRYGITKLSEELHELELALEPLLERYFALEAKREAIEKR